MTLLKEGSLNLKELEEKTLLFASNFFDLGFHFADGIVSRTVSRFGTRTSGVYYGRMTERRGGKRQLDVGLECQNLIEKSLLRLNAENMYELSEKGKRTAENLRKRLEKAAALLERQFFNSTAAAKNTVIADSFLALLKLLAGFLSGSVGLIADGADAAIDTVSATVVWIGMKVKKELLGTLIIIVMMFVTAISVGFESLTAIIEAITGTIAPISKPYLVIFVEAVSLVAAAILYLYQRFVGRRNGSLALISQSIDSKNHVYVAIAVIMGALFSILGIYFADALIGVFLAARILIDGFGLSKEALSSAKGEEIDPSRYETPLEKQWRLSRRETFQTWILYSMKEDEAFAKDELVNSLERTFNPKYIPIFSEFRFNLGEGFNFDEEFDNLTKPLLNRGLLVRKEGGFALTEKGRNLVNTTFKHMRFRQAG